MLLPANVSRRSQRKTAFVMESTVCSRKTAVMNASTQAMRPKMPRMYSTGYYKESMSQARAAPHTHIHREVHIHRVSQLERKPAQPCSARGAYFNPVKFFRDGYAYCGSHASHDEGWN